MNQGSILPLRLAEVSFTVGGPAIIDRVSLEIEAGPIASRSRICRLPAATRS